MRKASIGMLIGSLLFALSPALAQDREAAHPEFVQLERILEIKDKLIVTSEDGTKAEGQLIDIAAGRIVLRQRGGDHTISTPQITKIQRRRNGIWLGALIGAGASIPFALVAREYLNNEVGGGGAAAAKVIVLGTFAGIGIDALVSVPHTIYRRETKKGLTVQPVFGRKEAGIRFALSF